jgi:stearoyl-CoA desaturase (delta-9 desaturase)
MFTLSKFWERFFYLFTYITQGSSFLNPRAYAILHRLHHIHSDTELDPHSPKNSSNIFSMMWKTKNMYIDYLLSRRKVDPELEANVPRWKGLEEFAESYFSRSCWVLIYIGIYYWLVGNQWWWYLCLPITILMGPIHGAIVNWFGHKVGYRNFKSQDNSKNTLVADVLMMGELFQNNHHHLPLKPNFAVRWYEWDPTYFIIRILNRMGVVRLRRQKN